MKKLFNLFKKKKNDPTIKLTDFYNAVGEVAKEIGQDYYLVSITLSKMEGLTLTGYIHTRSHMSGGTIEEVCEKLRNYIVPKNTLPIEEVLIPVK